MDDVKKKTDKTVFRKIVGLREKIIFQFGDIFAMLACSSQPKIFINGLINTYHLYLQREISPKFRL